MFMSKMGIIVGVDNKVAVRIITHSILEVSGIICEKQKGSSKCKIL